MKVNAATATVIGAALLAVGAVLFGRLRWPVDGTLPSGFRTPERPTHNGVDIAVPIGTEVKAPAAGVVVDVFTTDNGGRSMLVDLVTGLRLGFAHLSDWAASPGDTFTRGELLAYTGNTGAHTTGPHLHLTVRRDGSWYMPGASLYSYPGQCFGLGCSRQTSRPSKTMSCSSLLTYPARAMFIRLHS